MAGLLVEVDALPPPTYGLTGPQEPAIVESGEDVLARRNKLWEQIFGPDWPVPGGFESRPAPGVQPTLPGTTTRSKLDKVRGQGWPSRREDGWQEFRDNEGNITWLLRTGDGKSYPLPPGYNDYPSSVEKGSGKSDGGRDMPGYNRLGDGPREDAWLIAKVVAYNPDTQQLRLEVTEADADAKPKDADNDNGVLLIGDLAKQVFELRVPKISERMAQALMGSGDAPYDDMSTEGDGGWVPSDKLIKWVLEQQGGTLPLRVGLSALGNNQRALEAFGLSPVQLAESECTLARLNNGVRGDIGVDCNSVVITGFQVPKQ